MRRIALFMLLVFGTSSRIAHASMIKDHQVVSASGGATAAEFTTIRTFVPQGAQYPMVERVLYKDDAGRMLVIRSSAQTAGPYSDSYQCLPSGETVLFDVVPTQSITVRLGDASMVINAASLGMNATGFPQAIVDQAATLFQGMSPSCRSSLSGVTEIGATYSTQFFGAANLFGALLFTNIPVVVPSVDTTSNRQDVVQPFDPSQTPPNAFELQFGNAYYQ